MTESKTIYRGKIPVLIFTDVGMMHRRMDLEQKLRCTGELLYADTDFIVRTLEGEIQLWEYFATWKVEAWGNYE